MNGWKFFLLKSFALFLCLSIGIFPIFSQTELDERALIEVGDAVTIKKDDDFLLNLRFRMQNRFGYFSTSGSDLSPERFEQQENSQCTQYISQKP